MSLRDEIEKAVRETVLPRKTRMTDPHVYSVADVIGSEIIDAIADHVSALLPPKGWRPSREEVAHALTRRKSIYETLAGDRDPFGEATDNAYDRATHGVEVMEHIEAEILALFDAAPVTKTVGGGNG